jgi:hypothetical protein
MKLIINLALALCLLGCAKKVEQQTFQSPSGDQTISLAHESCGAGCNGKDELLLNFMALDGTAGKTKIATIHGAAKIELGWISPERLVIGACNAGSADIVSDVIRLDKSNTSVRTEIVLTTVELPLQGRTYCSGF